ncbi:unnamed protein product [Vitrella brassicaformis CCMP3155]|uniref:FAS1 domain-containing protein n=1 Tax=Vitrella brassicaformis (strain CCMP3155) TaxID=1169540 RepID=A0A0G4EAH0_VITBC|nr:unnamed protein product [Vitrella brassicaformis CCMP3155]|eukprot:CEL92238.1 unnamed protein product [Vitrella brassicaformis CCMP3155]
MLRRPRTALLTSLVPPSPSNASSPPPSAPVLPRCVLAIGGQRWYNRNIDVRRRTQDKEVLNRRAYWWSEFYPRRRTVVDMCLNQPYLKRFGALLRHPEMMPVLHELSLPGPYTLFAPTDDALAKVEDRSIERLVNDTESLALFLRHHAVRQRWLLRDLVGSDYQPWKEYNAPREAPEELETLGGQVVSVSTAGSLRDLTRRVHIGSSTILPHKIDFRCHNGVVHCIDTPLIPDFHALV